MAAVLAPPMAGAGTGAVKLAGLGSVVGSAAPLPAPPRPAALLILCGNEQSATSDSRIFLNDPDISGNF